MSVNKPFHSCGAWLQQQQRPQCQKELAPSFAHNVDAVRKIEDGQRRATPESRQYPAVVWGIYLDILPSPDMLPQSLDEPPQTFATFVGRDEEFHIIEQLIRADSARLLAIKSRDGQHPLAGLWEFLSQIPLFNWRMKTGVLWLNCIYS